MFIKPQLATARLRLHASMMSICLPVCLSVWRQNAKKRDFLKKLSNLELWCLLTTYRKSHIGSRIWAFERTHYSIPITQDGWDPPSWNSTWRHFFCRGWSDLDKISQIGTEWHIDCGDVWKWKPDVEFQYGGRLGEFNGMSSHSHVSYVATWWIHCHDSRATCHIAGCSHLTKSMSWSCHKSSAIARSRCTRSVYCGIMGWQQSGCTPFSAPSWYRG